MERDGGVGLKLGISCTLVQGQLPMALYCMMYCMMVALHICTDMHSED